MTHCLGATAVPTSDLFGGSLVALTFEWFLTAASGALGSPSAAGLTWVALQPSAGSRRAAESCVGT